MTSLSTMKILMKVNTSKAFSLSVETRANRSSLEYNDDTTIIPRSTSVVARRLPAYRPGKGTAARYISGKMPATARSGPRVDAHITSRTENTATPSNPDLNSVQSEEDKIKAVFNLQETQWREQQEDMAM